MFKVSENGDGSTNIFCNKTGKLICTIRGQKANMGLGGRRPVNVVEPSPKPRSYHYKIDLKSDSLSEDDEKEESRKRCLSPLPEECLENYSHDCINEETFARVLNLIPKTKIETESLDELKSTFPLRVLSRNQAFVNNNNNNFREIKLPDDLPITSSLGIKILNLNKQKHFYFDQAIEMKIKNYESFCRFQLNSECSNFPKLRCREKKEYPICIPQKILRYGHTHMYAFNKRQRMENLITFRTGLTTRSRKLLLKCNKRLAVNIERLSPEEISTWLQKRSRTVHPITFDSIGGEEPSLLGSDSEATVIEQSSPFYIDVETISSSSNSSSSSRSNSSGDSYVMYPTSKEIVSFSGILRDAKRNSSPLKSRNRQNPKLIKSVFPRYDCFVKVADILSGIIKYYGDYYVKGTNIRVPFFSDFLNSFNQRELGPICIPEANGMASSCSDHAYHLPFSQSVARKKIIPNSQCLNHKSSKTKNKMSNCVKNKSTLQVTLNSVRNPRSVLKSSVSRDSSQMDSIPVIDLTEESAPVLVDKGGKSCPKSKYSKSLNWIFQCYGCGFKQMYKEEFLANSCATKHMRDFHCVSDPKSFIEVVRSGSDVRLEAFPGYKRMVDSCA